MPLRILNSDKYQDVQIVKRKIESVCERSGDTHLHPDERHCHCKHEKLALSYLQEAEQEGELVIWDTETGKISHHW